MKTLFKNVNLVNVFVDEIQRTNVLIDKDKIVGVCDKYEDSDADKVIDCSEKYMCPGFIDGHIHIESTKLTPPKFCEIAMPHGTLGVVCDPHEIANVCGTDGIDFMMQSSKGLPMDVFFMIPSCVPATDFDEAGAKLGPEDIKQYYGKDMVVGLAEMMNYPGVIFGDPQVAQKLQDAKNANMSISGHAPMLSGNDLCKYIASGIQDDHECSNFDEAVEKIKLGAHIMIRYGSSEKNLPDLIGLFDDKYNHSCSIATDDKDEADILSKGHMDDAIRKAIEIGVDPVVAIRMSSIQIAKHYHLKNVGAIAPGYHANFLLLDDLDKVSVNDVYYKGKLVAEGGVCKKFDQPKVDNNLDELVRDSVNIKKLNIDDFHIGKNGKHKCNVIGFIEKQVITDKLILDVDFDKNNGVDTTRDIVKVALVERHNATGHIGLGFVSGTKLQHGAVASTIGHDSHNIIVVGTNDDDMLVAANRVAEIHGGNVVVDNGKVLGEFSLPIAGLMSDKDPVELLKDRQETITSSKSLCAEGAPDLLLATAFLPLPVIPSLKITTHGLFDVDKFELCDLIVE